MDNQWELNSEVLAWSSVEDSNTVTYLSQHNYEGNGTKQLSESHQ